MPYTVDSPPERLKGKGIPDKFIRMFVHVWNSVYDRTKDEGRAWKAAYKTMGEALRKAGYTSDKDGKWHKEEVEEVLEGWLSGSQNDLDDGDFAWISNAYKKASPAEREKMNKGEHRKLPFKVHGKVNVRGWRAAWVAAANPGSARALKSYSGGPSREQVLAKLRANKPKGITIGDDNSITGEEALLDTVLLETDQKVIITEETENGELHFEGVALVDNAMSQNRRFYSATFNSRCMEETNRVIEEGGVVTIFSRHGRALGSFGSLPTGLPVGKVPQLFREGNEIRYKGVIVPTTEGKDMMTLMKTGVMFGTSIRANKYESQPREFEGETVEEMVSATLAGIDFTDDPGIKGAGVVRILEEAPKWEQEEQEMNWEELKLEELLEHAKPLLDEYAATVAEAVGEQATALQGKVAELEEAVVKLTEEKVTLAEQATAATEQLAIVGLKLKVAEAAHVGMSKSIYEELASAVAKEEDIPALLAEAKDKALAVALSGVSRGEPKGQTSFEDEDEDEDEEPQMTEEAKKILSLAG
jgi:hypothetical protein